MMEERYHATTQNRFYPDMSNVNKNITVEAKFISPPTYIFTCFPLYFGDHNEKLQLYTCVMKDDYILCELYGDAYTDV